MPSSTLFDRAAPILFVLIWSTGWIVPQYSSPDADPLIFLCVRFALAGLLLGAFALLSRAPFPVGREARNAVFSGMLLHGFYLSCVWWAVARGVPSTLSALLATVQPILTALAAPSLLGERLTRRKAVGVALGFVGLVITLSPKLLGVGGLSAPAFPLLVNLAGMLSITAGAMFQRKHLADGDLRAIAAVQYGGALCVTLPAALLFAAPRFALTAPVIGALAWSVLALSVGAIALLLLLIRHGEASRAATLLYLVPPTAAVQAAVLFGERLSLAQIVGFGVAIVGVVLARR